MTDNNAKMPKITFVIIPPVAPKLTFPPAESASYTAAEMATPNEPPRELAILYNPDASPTLLAGAFDTAVSVDGSRIDAKA